MQMASVQHHQLDWVSHWHRLCKVHWNLFFKHSESLSCSALEGLSAFNKTQYILWMWSQNPDDFCPTPSIGLSVTLA
jgi:hypothetical protein